MAVMVRLAQVAAAEPPLPRQPGMARMAAVAAEVAPLSLIILARMAATRLRGQLPLAARMVPVAAAVAEVLLLPPVTVGMAARAVLAAAVRLQQDQQARAAAAVRQSSSSPIRHPLVALLEQQLGPRLPTFGPLLVGFWSAVLPHGLKRLTYGLALAVSSGLGR